MFLTYQIFVQQVVALFRRMLADVPPQSLALILGVEVLPAQDYAILHAATKDDDNTFDVHKYVFQIW